MTSCLRGVLLACALWWTPAWCQIPDWGVFHYALYDNSDRPVGSYSFTIGREGALWRVSSTMEVDTTFLLLPVRLKDHNSFTHDGATFRSFSVRYFKDVPLQRTVEIEVTGARGDRGWTIRTRNGAETASRALPGDSFDEVRNLVSRLIRPETVLQPGQVRTSRSLDPLTLEVSEVESRGLEVDTIEFQGRRRRLYIMETRAADDNVVVKKFANGLIYRSQTAEGYALLTSARMPSF